MVWAFYKKDFGSPENNFARVVYIEIYLKILIQLNIKWRNIGSIGNIQLIHHS
jgi:hypothetical protein